MKLSQLAHVLRAAADISGEKTFVVVGSQAVLLAMEHPGADLTLSDEIDMYPPNAPEKADIIDGSIGALSRFHDEFGYHADGVSPETAAMPAGWMDRARLHYFGDITAVVPDIHDLAASKCAAMRGKDADFVRALFREGHVNLELLEARLALLDAHKFAIPTLVAWARRRSAEAEAPR